jgi:hypothetical protein
MKLLTAIKFGYWAYKHPKITSMNYFPILASILELIMKVATEHRNYSCRIASVLPGENTQDEIVSIWAGAGIGADIHKRVDELYKENQLLKSELSRLVKEEQK